MLVVMKPNASEGQIDRVVARIKEAGLTPHAIPGADRTAIGMTGNKGRLSREVFLALPGVAEAIAVTQPFKLVSQETKPEPTVVDVDGVPIGGPEACVIAGPCSVESEEQLLSTARHVARGGAHLLRGGAYKPRTSPYDFQGLGEDGLRLLALAKAETGLRTVTEVISSETAETAAKYVDMLQVGARNMQNFALLNTLGDLGKPVLLKRGMSATLKELLMAAEYIVSRGNYQVVLCERGIRTFETMTRNTLDLGAVVVLKGLTHLPVLVDPSHGIGRRDGVIPLARAGIAVGADGVIVEVHPKPAEALSDGPQALTFPMFDTMMGDLARIADAVDRGFPKVATQTQKSAQ